MPPRKTANGGKRKLDVQDSETGNKTIPPRETRSGRKLNAEDTEITARSSEGARPAKKENIDGPSNSSETQEPTSGAVDVNANKDPGARPFTSWLFKSEPETRLENGIDVKFGFDDLKAEPNQTACWDGVRNYQARNFMKDQMCVGDRAFFYHSNAKPSGVIGLVHVVKESYVDHTQFDRKDPHYDPKATREKPRWFMVDVKYDRSLKRYIPLPELKELHESHKKSGGPLKNLALFTKARLSVQPLTEEEFDFILSLENGR